MLSLLACLLTSSASAILDCKEGLRDCTINPQSPIVQKIQALLNGIDLLSWYKDWLKGFEVDYIKIKDLRESYDFIVIGAGVGGSVVAHRLAMDSSHPSVLLLEAGDEADNSGLSFEMVPTFTGENQMKEHIDWEYYSQPSDYCCKWHINTSHYMPRGKVMGGSGVLNYMLWVRGHKDDWNELMNVDGWKYEDVLPYFQRCESLSTHAYDGIRNESTRGYDGPVIVNSVNELKSKESIFEEAVIRACQEAGIPFLRYGQNTGDNMGIAVSEFNIDDEGHRSGPFVAYNKYMRQKYKTEYESGLIKLDILPNAYVTKILFDDTKTKATGVIFTDISDKIFKFRRNKEYTIKLSSKGEVILSGGAFNSPQLLMLSGIGPKEELDKFGIDIVQDLPGVGQNLQDHPWVQMRYHWDEQYQDQAFTLDKVLETLTDFDQFKEYLMRGRGPLATSGVQLTAFIKSNLSTDTFPDLQLYFTPGLPANPEQFNYKENVYIDHECGDKEYYTDLNNMQSIGTFVGLQHPESKGYVKLQSKDPFVYPLIQPNYLKEQIDVDKLKYGLKKLDGIMQQISMKRLWDERMDCKKYGNIFNDDRALEQYIRDSVANIYHPIGTCKMGDIENDEMAVVDDRLKVKGIDNLRIVDASILPFQTSGNTQVPVFMIGERASEFILQEYIDSK